jgi:ketosteroid isomerase-like protein
MRLHRWILAFCLIVAAPLSAQTSADEAAVRTAVTGFHSALTAGDVKKAMSLIADDAVFLEAGGVETRAQYEKDHLPADIEFEKGVKVKRSPIRIVVVGDAAWASSTTEFQGTFQGRTIDSLGAELMVLSKVGGAWKIRAVNWSGRARPTASK